MIIIPNYYNPYSNTSVSAMVLSQAEMQINVKFMWEYMFRKYGWTAQATAGMAANCEAESTINPSRPQNNAMNNKWYPSAPGYIGDAPTPTTTWYGYGLFQITPYLALSGIRENPYNYGNWALSNGYNFSWENGGTGGKMEPQLDWLMSGAPEHPYYNSAQPSANQAKWYDNSKSPFRASTPAIYGKSTQSPENCASTFYYNLERSAAGTPGNRPQLARKWYDYITSLEPIPPSSDSDKSNFLIIAYASGVINDG